MEVVVVIYDVPRPRYLLEPGLPISGSGLIHRKQLEQWLAHGKCYKSVGKYYSRSKL